MSHLVCRLPSANQIAGRRNVYFLNCGFWKWEQTGGGEIEIIHCNFAIIDARFLLL